MLLPKVFHAHVVDIATAIVIPSVDPIFHPWVFGMILTGCHIASVYFCCCNCQTNGITEWQEVSLSLVIVMKMLPLQMSNAMGTLL